MPPQISLIITTLNRTWQLENSFQHLARQNYRDFECIVVDQNDDDRLAPIIDKYKSHFPIIHMHSAQGISLGRNTGMTALKSDLAAFPDDDCWYGEDLLKRVTDFFMKHPDIDIITGRTINSFGKTSLGKFDKKPGKITKRNVFKRGNTNSVFLRRRVADQITFDEELGPSPGSKWGSGEETDYLLRALAAGFHLYYDPDLTVYHEEPIMEYNEKTITRGYYYGSGMGRVLKKHHYPLDFILIRLFYQIGGMVIALAKLDIQRYKYHRAVFKGRLKGWLSPYTG